MSIPQIQDGTVRVSVRNIGGISQSDVEFDPGVTILTGRNATNRTSFLQAIMLALGSDRASLKADAEEGSVELQVGEDTYTRTLTRQNGTVTFDGEPYLSDAEIADLFAFLLEGNEARQAVSRGDDLRELIMRPIDTEEIQAEIERLEAERRDIDEQLEEIERDQRQLVDLEQRREKLETEIEDTRAELQETESDLESLDSTVEESRAEKEQLESRFDELRETRSELETVRQRIETTEASIESLNDERDEVRAELDAVDEEPDRDVDSIEDDIDRLRNRHRNLETMVGELQSVIQFNEEMLDGDNADVRTALNPENTTDGSPTDRLLETDTICWTCGSEVEKDQIATTIDRLRTVRRDNLEQIQTIEERLDELKEKRRTNEEIKQRREELESRLDAIADELETRQSDLEDLQTERGRVSTRLEEIEAKVDEVESESEEFSAVLDKHKEANQLEFELGQLQGDLDDVIEEIEANEAHIDQRDRLEAEREELSSELVDLRTRIDQIEEQAVEQFNDHMETILNLLEYENIDRIWIERVEREVREGRRKVTRSQFDLHVVRVNEEGVAYEDTVDHLSESERKVTGLVFALAGYLVHDVYETLPFIILDSLEAVDANRIARLVEYFSDYATYSVVALLPEDETALDDSHQRVTDI